MVILIGDASKSCFVRNHDPRILLTICLLQPTASDIGQTTQMQNQKMQRKHEEVVEANHVLSFSFNKEEYLITSRVNAGHKL